MDQGPRTKDQTTKDKKTASTLTSAFACPTCAAGTAQRRARARPGYLSSAGYWLLPAGYAETGVRV